MSRISGVGGRRISQSKEDASHPSGSSDANTKQSGSMEGMSTLFIKLEILKKNNNNKTKTQRQMVYIGIHREKTIFSQEGKTTDSRKELL